MFRFTLRDLFWLTLLAAVLLLWWRQQRAMKVEMYTLIRGKATAESLLQTNQNRLQAAQSEARAMRARWENETAENATWPIRVIGLPRGGGCGRRFAGAGGGGGLAGHEAVAAAGAGDAEAEGLQLFVDAQAQRRVGDGRFGLNLPPFAVLAEAPRLLGLLFCHGFASLSCVRRRTRHRSNERAGRKAA